MMFKNLKTITPEELMHMRISELKGSMYAEYPIIALIPGFCTAQTSADLQGLFTDKRFPEACKNFVNCLIKTENTFIVAKEITLDIGFQLDWEVDGVGTGKITFAQDDNGQHIMTTDGMSKHFVRSILLSLVNKSTIID